MSAYTILNGSFLTRQLAALGTTATFGPEPVFTRHSQRWESAMDQINCASPRRTPSNKGKTGRLECAAEVKGNLGYSCATAAGATAQELAMFNLAIDSKLRSCDFVKLRVRDVCHGDRVATPAIEMQQKTQRPV